MDAISSQANLAGYISVLIAAERLGKIHDLGRAVRANVLLGSVRIMMVTTEASMKQLEQALAAGVNEYLMKPFNKELLLQKLALLGIT